jgi:hypothetical protein
MDWARIGLAIVLTILSMLGVTAAVAVIGLAAKSLVEATRWSSAWWWGVGLGAAFTASLVWAWYLGLGKLNKFIDKDEP